MWRVRLPWLWLPLWRRMRLPLRRLRRLRRRTMLRNVGLLPLLLSGNACSIAHR